MTDLHALLRDAYLLGFMSSGEGYNGEYPFSGLKRHPPNYAHWTELRDTELAPLLARIDAALAEPQWRPLSEWHDDDGDVLWHYRDGDDWDYYVGSPLSSDWPHVAEVKTGKTVATLFTHWMPMPPLPEKP